MTGRYSGGRASLAAAMPLAEVEGTTLALGTTAGTLTVPTDPQAHGVILHGIIGAEAFFRVSVAGDPTAANAGYLAQDQDFVFALNPVATEIRAAVDSGAGTVYATWLYAGSVG